MQRSRRIPHPTGMKTHIDDRLLDFRQAPAGAIVNQETAFGTEGVLTEVALSSSGRFPAFDDLVTLAVRAADSDERHGPFLPKGGYEDEAQCDIARRPSPLLKHYRFWDGPHYHYGPRNKNHRIYWDRTVIENPLEWVFEQCGNKKLGAMIERAGYPGVAADLDHETLAALLPTIKTQAWKMWKEGEALTGHPGLPLEVTPNLVTR